MAKDLFDKLLDLYFTTERQGRRGEKLTERELKLVRLMGRGGKILRNVYVPKPNGETSEIDLIYITQKGIFVIESKHYSGWIFGNESNRNWTQSLKGGAKNRFQNPIIQNRGHIKWLRNFLQDNTPLFSIIAFSEKCELKKITLTSEDIPVTNRDHLYATVRNIWDQSPDVLDEAAVEVLFAKLESLTNVGAATKEAHIANIKVKYGENAEDKPRTAAPEKTNETQKDDTREAAITADSPSKLTIEPDSQICPYCGAPLVLRTAKIGANAGNQFYGCSAFPHCRYTKACE